VEQDTPSNGVSHGTVEYMHLDLSSLANVRDFAKQWRRRRESALTVLVNNAGMNSFSVQKGLEYTSDGFDRIWQARALSRGPHHHRPTRSEWPVALQREGTVQPVGLRAHGV